MKINLSTTFATLGGGSINGENGKPITLRIVIENSLSLARCGMAPTKAWDLAKRVHINESDVIDIVTEDLVHVKEAIASHSWYPMIVAQAHAAIEAGVEDEKAAE